MLHKKRILFLVVLLGGSFCFGFTQVEKNIEQEVTITDLHEKIKGSGTQILNDFLKNNPTNNKEILQFIQKRKKLRDLQAQVYPIYQKAQELGKSNKQEAIKFYNQTLSNLKKGKGNIGTDELYIQLDIANIQKNKSQMYKDLKDTKNQETTLNDMIDTYNQAIISYSKNPKEYDDGSNPEVHIGKILQYEKASTLEELANLKKNKTDKKKIFLEIVESYQQMLKYNTLENCDAGCVIVDSSKIKEIYTKMKNL